jgi:cytoplasmic iron level regulating protein YaaA (DUF328/UPF0246 family)
MLFVLSPAKKLDYDSALNVQTHTQPLFVKGSCRVDQGAQGPFRGRGG